MRNVTAIIIACLNRNFLFLLKPFRIFYDFVPSKIQNPCVLKQIFLIKLNKISMNLLISLGSAHFLLTLLQYLAKNQRSFVVYILKKTQAFYNNDTGRGFYKRILRFSLVSILTMCN